MFFSVFYDFSQLELGSWMLDLMEICNAQHPNNPKNSSISFRSNFKVNQSTHKKTLQNIQFIIEKIAIFIYFPIHHPTGLKNGFSKKKIILGSQKKRYEKLRNRHFEESQPKCYFFYPRLARQSSEDREKKIQFRINFGIEIKKELENISFHRNLIAVFSSGWLIFFFLHKTIY